MLRFHLKRSSNEQWGFCRSLQTQIINNVQHTVCLQTIKLPDINYKRRGEHLHPRDQGRTQKRLATRGRGEVTAYLRGNGEVTDLEINKNSEAAQHENYVEVVLRVQDIFQAQLWIFIINHLVQCKETSTELFRKISRFTTNLHILYKPSFRKKLSNHPISIFYALKLSSQHSSLLSIIYSQNLNFKPRIFKIL